MDQKLDQPLSDFEFDRLEMILSRLRGDTIRTLEGVDGFFAALMCSPRPVPPSEYLPQIWGELSEQEELPSLEHVRELLGLLTRHWNTIARCFSSGEIFVPLLLEDERGIARGNDWAQGFLRGLDMCPEDWGILFEDEEDEAAMLPIFMLAHEHDPDPGMRPEPIPNEKREDLITFLAMGVNHIYRRFEEERRGGVIRQKMYGRTGRNELCPCGSGRKYKRCCGGVTVH